MSGDIKTFHITCSAYNNRRWLQVVMCSDGDQVINWQMKFSVIEHKIMHIGLSLFPSKLCVAMDIYYCLDKASLSCNRYIIENGIIVFSNSQKAN